MKQYLIDTFSFNDLANKKLLEKIKQLPDKKEAVKMFSHLINCQYKWMARIIHDPRVQQMDWWNPVYDLCELEAEWDKSLRLWIDYINSKPYDELSAEVTFIGFDGSHYEDTPKDVALQLNYYSINHMT